MTTRVALLLRRQVNTTGAVPSMPFATRPNQKRWLTVNWITLSELVE